jgi:hypothetical protein
LLVKPDEDVGHDLRSLGLVEVSDLVLPSEKAIER